MDVLAFETCWAVNSEIIKQVTSSWSIFIQQLFDRPNLQRTSVIKQMLMHIQICETSVWNRPILQQIGTCLSYRISFPCNTWTVFFLENSYENVTQNVTKVFWNVSLPRKMYSSSYNIPYSNFFPRSCEFLSCSLNSLSFMELCTVPISLMCLQKPHTGYYISLKY